MNKSDYIDLVATLEGEHFALLEKRERLEDEIAEIDSEMEAIGKAIANLRPLTGELSSNDPLTGMGLTLAIKTVLCRAKSRLSAAQVKEELEKQGFSFAKYKMPMASIYTTLDRLHKKGEINIEKEGYSRFFMHK